MSSLVSIRKGALSRGVGALAMALTAMLVIGAVAFADAPDPVPGSAQVRLGPVQTVNGVQVVRVSINGEWQWPTHHSDCNTNRTGAGYAIDWGDPNDAGNPVTVLNGQTINVGSVGNLYNPADNEVHPTRPEEAGSQFADPGNPGSYASWRGGCGTYNGTLPQGVWGAVDLSSGTGFQATPITCATATTDTNGNPAPSCLGGSHVYTVQAIEQGIKFCEIAYDVHGKSSDVGGAPNGSKEITAGGSGHNGDNGAEKNGSTPVGNSCEQIPVPKPSDVSIVKTGPGIATVGGNVRFTLVARNLGPGDSTNTVVSDRVPGNYSFISADNGGQFSNGTVTWNLGTLANGGSRTLHITLRLNRSVINNNAHCQTNNNHSNPNTATISGDGDSDSSNNSSTWCVRTPNWDLSILKTASPSNAAPGQNVTFSLAVHNFGPGTATNVKITDPLPSNYLYVSDDGDCSLSNGVVTCQLGSLAQGSTRTIHLVLKLQFNVTDNSAPCGGSPNNPNTGIVSSTPKDTNPSNNQSTACVGPPPAKPDVSILKTAAGPANPGQNVTFTLVGRNLGPGTAQNVRITDPIPSNYSYVSDDGGCSLSNGVLTCQLGTLANGESRTIHLVLHLNFNVTDNSAPCGGNPNNPNTAFISSNPADSNGSNNQSTACVPNNELKGHIKVCVNTLGYGTSGTYTFTATGGRSVSIFIAPNSTFACDYLNGRWAAGTIVTVQEQIPSGIAVTGINVDPSSQTVSKNVSAGNVTVKVFNDGNGNETVTTTFFQSHQ